MTEDQSAQDNRVSTVLGRRLGGELLQLRTQAGFTQGQAAKALTASTAKVAKMERGWVPMRDPDIRALCELYGVVEPTMVGGLLELARLDRERRKVKGWWNDLPKNMKAYIELENVATSIKTWQVSYVPGLLQTPDYIHALRPDEHFVAARIERQRRLVDSPPLALWAVVHEAALRCVVGGRDVMGGQLEHLVQVSRKPNITLQVLPFSAGTHMALGAAINILSFADAGAMDVMYMEVPLTQRWAEGGEETARHAALFDNVAKAALSPADSRAFIGAMSKET
ncbi:helix-turn-helix domain-containing protein [Streptomyces netropsis]|uniref:Transcriptional regulator with XRE-family HTH domain n=1 Tax=Streptomyces netropsis TaxID=55404 RepID=A0A7W7L791_STRNE|nr:helix-turn-helix transcriptional regulator [Streptomyces netropsis]MBB4884398.1 transcriptional regulator with XRE-family HTH domain [Streptomyces netropsis]GGR03965.1 transcriptional regulator [Streptomyces netropsis]